MQAHLTSQDDDMLYVITDGSIKNMKINTDVAITGEEPQIPKASM